MSIQRAGTPVLVGRFVHIPEACRLGFDPQKGAVMGPTQFVTQCVTDWKCLIKQTHVAQIGGIGTPPEFRRQRFGQPGDKACAVACTVCAMLLELDDMAADFPARAHLDGIDGAQCLPAG